MNSVLMPVNQVIGSRSITSFRLVNGRGLGIRMLRPPTAKKIIRFAVNAKMWYSGSAVSITSLPRSRNGFHISRLATTFASRLRCVSNAPFETPVVPPVYCSAAMLSSVSAVLIRCAGSRPLAMRARALGQRLRET